MLKNSKRNCTRDFSVTGKFLRRPTSNAQKPGCITALRVCVAHVPFAGRAYAFLLNQTADVVNGVFCTSFGSPT